MLRITQPPATTAVAAEHPVATVGRYLVRYALVVVIAWIGALKYTGYESAAIQPLIAHSPIFSWFYSRTHRGWSRSREIFGACGRAAGGGYPVRGAAGRVRAGLRVGLDGGGLPVTPTGLWDLSPFYSLAAGT
jgi:hypothetical protein